MTTLTDAYNKGCTDMIEIINKQLALMPNPLFPICFDLILAKPINKLDGYDPPKDDKE